MSSLQPGQMLGPYQIISQVGRGGMATVYKAYHAAMDRYVALKIVATQLSDDPNFMQRFRREVRLIAKLEHPHILPVHDFGDAEGIPYMVMRFLEAGTLKERLEAGPLSIKEIDRVFTQLADALEYAHENGVIHRDIKPSNAMLDKRGDIFLTDFGVAKMLEGVSSLTATGTVTGTPSYMSPEQAQGLKVDQRSDIYSLGIVLFEMLTGHVPFEAETPMAVLFKQIQDPPPPLSIVRPDLPYTFEAVLLKAMAKDPADRFHSMDDFRDSWKNALAEAATIPPAAPAFIPEPVPPQPTPPSLPAVNAASLPPEAPTVAAATPTLAPAAATLAAAPAQKKAFPFKALAIGGIVVILILGALLTLRFMRNLRTQAANQNHQNAAQTVTAVAQSTATPLIRIIPSSVPPMPVEITLWYTYAPGSAEGDAMLQLLDQAARDLPEVKIRVVSVPFTDIFDKYRTEVASGAGPDLFIAPNDSLGDDVRAGLIADISELAQGQLKDYSDSAIQGMTVDEKLYGIPESQKAMVLWYDKTRLPNPPRTTEELRVLMAGGTPVSMGYGCYHHFGFYGAFGGRLFDENRAFVAGQGSGFIDAMAYMNNLYKIAKKNGWPRADSNDPDVLNSGKVVAMANGNWLMGDFKRALGDKLAVAPLPAGPAGPARPFLGVDGYYFNPNSKNKAAALRAALYLTNAASQKLMMERAGHVPTRSDVPITDPLINGLMDAFRNGYIRPQDPQFSKYWSNFCNTDDVFEKGVTLAAWLKAATSGARAAANTEKVTIRWFVGLGAGTADVQMEAQKKVVNDFNKSQDKITLVLEIVPNATATNMLAKAIAAGNAPDIIGPVGWLGSNAFHGQWLDLKDLIAKNKYDTSDFNPEMVNMYQTDEGTAGIPFAVYPGVFFFQRKMFDQAGLSYPPNQVGQQYKMPDGSLVDWNWDTVAKIARLLTLDKNGRNATQVDFDPRRVAQYGFVPQWMQPSYFANYYGMAAKIYTGSSKGNYQAAIPDQWKSAWTWWYDGMWGKQPFIPNAPAIQSNDFGAGNPFNSGKIAMAVTQSYYLCCINGAGRNWELTILPLAADGKIHGRVDADTFRIWKGTKHPDEAFTVLTYLLGPAAGRLTNLYGAFPARTSLQARFLQDKAAQFPFVKNFSILQANLAYIDVPSAESYMPNLNEAWRRLQAFGDLMANNGNLNLSAEINKLNNDLSNTIFNR